MAIVLGAVAVLWAVSRCVPIPGEDAGTGMIGLWWVAMMVRTLQFQLAIGCLGLGALAVWIRDKKLIAFSGVVALLPLIHWPAWLFTQPAANPAAPLRVLTCNLLTGNNRHTDTLRMIQSTGADVVLLQEYDREWDQFLYPALSASHAFHSRQTRDDAFGMAVYSRLKWQSPPDWQWNTSPQPLPQVRLEVITESGQELVIYGIHLLPPLHPANVRSHLSHLRTLTENLEKETGPVLLGGDFNFTPHSAQALRLESLAFTECWDRLRAGRGTTWPTKGLLRFLPGLRLDHFFLRGQEWVPLSIDRLPPAGSDHHPVLLSIGSAPGPSVK